MIDDHSVTTKVVTTMGWWGGEMAEVVTSMVWRRVTTKVVTTIVRAGRHVCDDFQH